LDGKRTFSGAGIPTAGTYVVGDRVQVKNPQYGYTSFVCVAAGTPGTWVGDATRTVPLALPDADFTYTPGSSHNYYIEVTALTANRAVTLSTTGAQEGQKVTFVRRSSAVPYSLTIDGSALYSRTAIEYVFLGGSWRSGDYHSLRNTTAINYLGDVNYTHNAYDSFGTLVFQSALSTNRTVTLSTSGATVADRVRVLRKASATGASTLTASGVTIPINTWADFNYDGTVWVPTAAGTLP